MNCCGLFNAKAILREEEQWCFLTHSREGKGVPTSPRGICLKVNAIARLEFELAYYDSVVQCFKDGRIINLCMNSLLSKYTITKYLNFPLIHYYHASPTFLKCPRSSVDKALNCRIVVSEFNLRSRYNIHSWKRYEPPNPPSYGLNRTTTVLLEGWFWH